MGLQFGAVVALLQLARGREIVCWGGVTDNSSCCLAVAAACGRCWELANQTLPEPEARPDWFWVCLRPSRERQRGIQREERGYAVSRSRGRS